jgi:pilus assembly protein CpaB
MRLKHIFLVLLLLSVGVAAVLIVRAMPKNSVAAASAAPAAPVVHAEILVATRPLPPGLLLRAQDVTWRERPGEAQAGEIKRPSNEPPKEAAEPTTKAKSGVLSAIKPAEPSGPKLTPDEAALAPVYGAAVRVAIAEGQPITAGNIVKPGDRDFLPTVLTQGTRAATISVAAGAGGSGMMFAGDYVDVMLTQTFKNDAAPLTRRSVSETVVENLRVLAIDKNAKPQPGMANNNPITVTLEVAPQQAEKINVAQELGKLSLTLRSRDEPASTKPVAATASPAPPSPPPPPPAPTWAGDVSPALKAAVPTAKVIEAEKPPIKVMRGTNSSETKSH